jgi:hypothetical protein
MKLIIPEIPPSLNKTQRMHWATQRKLSKMWAWLIRSKLPEMHLEPIVKMRVSVTLCHSRFFDKDNAYGACKPLVDGLKTWGLVRDDTAEFLELTVEQEKCPHKQRHTIIDLEAA